MDSSQSNQVVQQVSEQMISLIDALSALRSIAEIWPGSGDDAALLKEILTILIQNQGVEYCSIYIVKDGKLNFVAGLNWQRAQAGAGKANVEPDGYAKIIELGDGLIGKAAQSMSLQHFKASGAHQASVTQGSMISVPIKSGQNLIGVLSVTHPHDDHFNEWHERLLLTYTQLVAKLFITHRIILKYQQEAEMRERQLQDTLQQVEEMKQNHGQLITIDELTGLHNQPFFHKEASNALNRAIRYKNSLAILLINLDEVRSSDGGISYELLSECQLEVAKLLKEISRNCDIIAKFNEQEFIFALPNTAETGARVLAERASERIATLEIANQKVHITLTASMGIALYNPIKDQDNQEITTNLDRLIQIATDAVTVAKQKSENKIVVGSD